MNDSLIVLFLGGVLVVAIGLIIIISLSRRLPKGLNKEKYQADWLKIEHSLSEDHAAQSMAIINADKLLDRALKEKAFKGETMGERLGAASRQLTNCDAVWAAHKLRNKVAHETDVKLNLQLTKKVMIAFRQALKDMGAL